MFSHLTSTELNRAYSAADYLYNNRDHLKLDPSLAVKLSTLRSDLSVEKEDRNNIAGGRTTGTGMIPRR